MNRDRKLYGFKLHNCVEKITKATNKYNPPRKISASYGNYMQTARRKKKASPLLLTYVHPVRFKNITKKMLPKNSAQSRFFTAVRNLCCSLVKSSTTLAADRRKNITKRRRFPEERERTARALFAIYFARVCIDGKSTTVPSHAGKTYICTRNMA